MKSLAIDQGTTSTRALVVDEHGKCTTLFTVTHQQYYPQSGWVEHDPQELLNSIKTCLDAAENETSIGAVGIANQGESCLAWDSRTGEAVYPVIVWQDDRTRDDITALERQGAQVLVRERAGLPLAAYFSASKLGWILHNVPKARSLAEQGHLRLGTTDAFFRDRLTNRFETDLTTASRTSLMNLATCEWDPELCKIFGVPIDLLPQITPTTGDFGTVNCGSCFHQLTTSIVDQQASLYGHGCRKAGDSKMTFGTGAFALTVTGPKLHLNANGPLPTVAWQKYGERPTYALDGGVYAASSAVNWAQRIGLFQKYSEINRFEKPSAIERGLAFVPAFSGLACPHWDRSARGAWLGLCLDTTPLDMVQAILEGIAFRMAEVATSMQAEQAFAGAISIDGGMVANPYFCQFLADTLNRELVISDHPDLTAVGTAALAAEAAGFALPFKQGNIRIRPNRMSPETISKFRVARMAVQTFGGSAHS